MDYLTKAEKTMSLSNTFTLVWSRERTHWQKNNTNSSMRTTKQLTRLDTNTNLYHYNPAGTLQNNFNNNHKARNTRQTTQWWFDFDKMESWSSPQLVTPKVFCSTWLWYAYWATMTNSDIVFLIKTQIQTMDEYTLPPHPLHSIAVCLGWDFYIHLIPWVQTFTLFFFFLTCCCKVLQKRWHHPARMILPTSCFLLQVIEKMFEMDSM